MTDNYIFTETKVTTNRVQSLPLDDLLSLANKIWGECKNDQSEDAYNRMYDKYKEFGSSFPLILRWMVQMNKYSPKAFKKFLIKYSSANIESKKDFILLQADYLVYLYEENAHYDKKHVNTYRDFIIKQLLEEEEKLKQIEDEFKKEMESYDRKRLYKYITSADNEQKMGK